VLLFAPAAAKQTYRGIDLYTLSQFNLSRPNPAVEISGYAVNGQVVGDVITGRDHASAWSGPDGAIVDLNPTNLGYFESSVYGTDGVYQVGVGEQIVAGGGGGPPIPVDPIFAFHALLWSGSAESAVTLDPPGYSAVVAIGVHGSQQVGYGLPSHFIFPFDHALLWNGTANTFVDLNPTNLNVFIDSYAYGTDGTHQVGYGKTSSGNIHALLWSGTAGSAFDLHPSNLSGFNDSYAVGIDGNQQVGYGGGNGTNFIAHALLWQGSANSAVDLNPSNLNGIPISTAFSTNGHQQVGYGYGPNIGQHALLWSGTADSAVDLHSLLPVGFSSSQAVSINVGGEIFGVATDSNGYFHAVEWVPVPEPSAQFLLAIGSLALIVMRGRRTQMMRR
jgi:hypothetical protein